MKPPAPPSFVWYSTPESRAAGTVSLLAVAETLICVALYWLLWLKWGVTWHHWLIVLATPLVLMRSEVSVWKGIEWFEAYLDSEDDMQLWSVKAWLIIAFAGTCAFGAAWALAQAWLADYSGLGVAWRSFLVGLIGPNIVLATTIAIDGKSGTKHGWFIPMLVSFAGAFLGAGIVAGVMVGLSAAVLAQSSLVLLLGVSTGLGLRSLATRFVATLLRPLAGLQSIPTNWQLQNWASDFLHPPELLPEYKRTSFRHLYWGLRSKASPTAYDYVAHLFIGIILYVPTLLWRWSIKSTAWFYLPLLWVGRGWQNIHGNDLLIWAKGYSR